MTKSYFVIFCLIFIGVYVKDAYLEESKLNDHVISSLNPARTKRSSKRSAQGRNLAAVGEDFDDGFTELREGIKTLEDKVSQLKNDARGALTALYDQLTNQALTISEMQITQTQISNVMTSMMTTLTKLDLKIDTEFAKMDTKFGKLETDHIQLNKKIKALHQEEVESNCSTRIPPVDCKSLMKNGCFLNGVYTIRPRSTFQVLCDLEDDDGGWTVIQRRGVRDIPKAQRENFNRSWTEYERGFGSVDDDHWIGLQQMHTLTKDCENELKITLTRWNGTQLYVKYSNFQISGVEDDYRLILGNITAGTLGISRIKHMGWNNGMKFTTFDKDNDKDSGNCAVLYGGAWWHNECSNVALNGEYAEDGTNGRMKRIRDGIYWFPDLNHYSFKKSEMKIRSKC